MRELDGIHQAGPSIDGAAERDYVIVGADWPSPPQVLLLDDGAQLASVVDETPPEETSRSAAKYMARNLTLPSDGEVEAMVQLQDGTSVACVVKIQSVC